ncbi:MAG: hypothetical protein ACYC2P_08755 [Paludibacteraceae bacterium]
MKHYLTPPLPHEAVYYTPKEVVSEINRFKIIQTRFDTDEGRITIKGEVMVKDLEKYRRKLQTEHNAHNIIFTYEDTLEGSN